LGVPGLELLFFIVHSTDDSGVMFAFPCGDPDIDDFLLSTSFLFDVESTSRSIKSELTAIASLLKIYFLEAGEAREEVGVVLSSIGESCTGIAVEWIEDISIDLEREVSIGISVLCSAGGS